MTRKEIIDGLKFTVDMFLFDPNTGETYTEPRNDMDKTTVDACKGAIELLEKTDGDLISRQAVIDVISSVDNGENHIDELTTNVIGYIEQLPSAEKTDGDLISRNDVINMFNTMDRYRADKLILQDTDREFPSNEVFIVDDCYELLEQLPTYSAEQADGDLISRQEAIDIVVFECGEWTGLAKEISKQLRQLQSADNTAEWKAHYNEKDHRYSDLLWYCSNCGERFVIDGKDEMESFRYCPNCGCRMLGVE